MQNRSTLQLIYQQPTASFTWRNPTERREYDWGNGTPGSLIRRTHYNYLHLTNPAYQGQNLADLPTSVTVYDGSGNIVAQTQTVFSIGYDFHVGNGNNGNVFAIANNRDSTRNQTFTYDALNKQVRISFERL